MTNKAIANFIVTLKNIERDLSCIFSESLPIRPPVPATKIADSTEIVIGLSFERSLKALKLSPSSNVENLGRGARGG